MFLNLNSPIAATKDLLLAPEALALFEQQLVYDSNLNLMWQSSRTTSQPALLFAHLIGRRWMVRRDRLLSSLASTLCPCNLNE